MAQIILDTEIHGGKGDMSIKPLGNRVLLKVVMAEEKSAGGIYIPPSAQEKTQEGLVVSVGEGDEINVNANQTVIYDKYAGTQIKVNGEEHLVIKMEDIIAVVEN